jgi:6-phosphofructokinase 1
MGRKCGYLALMSGIAGGAEAAVIPEREIDPEEVADILRIAYERGKSHAIIVVAEGAAYNAEKLVAYFEKHRERLGFAVRATILGHVQRGGNPGAFDRILASRFGAKAVDCIVKKKFGVLVGLQKGELTTTDLDVVVKNKKILDLNMFELARILD